MFRVRTMPVSKHGWFMNAILKKTDIQGLNSPAMNFMPVFGILWNNKEAIWSFNSAHSVQAVLGKISPLRSMKMWFAVFTQPLRRCGRTEWFIVAKSSLTSAQNIKLPLLISRLLTKMRKVTSGISLMNSSSLSTDFLRLSFQLLAQRHSSATLL